MKTLSIGYYFRILNILEGMGVSRDEVANIVPLNTENDTRLNVRVQLTELQDLLNRGGESLKDTHIGMHTSQNFRISTYGHGGEIFSTCETVKQAITLSIKYADLAHTIGQFRESPEKAMDPEVTKYIWTANFEPRLKETYKQTTECIISNYVATINWLSWSVGKSVKKVTFQHSGIEPLSEYKRILDCEVEFNAPETSIILNRKAIETSLPTSNPLKLSSLEKKLNLVLADYNKGSNIVERVRYALHLMIKHRRPTLISVAQELSLSQRTLKRYLEDHDVSYRELLQSVKMELCDIYIKQAIPYSEIAQMLWYHDQSALTRAYKKWHGTSPTKR